MSKQQTLFAQSAPDMNEAEAFSLVLPTLMQVMDQENIPQYCLTLERKKNFSSIMLSTYLVARLCFRGADHHMEVPSACRALICAPLHAEEGPKGFLSVPIVPTFSIAAHGVFMQQILAYTIARIPKEFDCCSRVVACSDAKRCNTPLQELAMGCGYKRNLRAGRFFYGKNRKTN